VVLTYPCAPTPVISSDEEDEHAATMCVCVFRSLAEGAFVVLPRQVHTYNPITNPLVYPSFYWLCT
jgi:hypothetical protein